jgi:hypothetical protein
MMFAMRGTGHAGPALPTAVRIAITASFALVVTFSFLVATALLSILLPRRSLFALLGLTLDLFALLLLTLDFRLPRLRFLVLPRLALDILALLALRSSRPGLRYRLGTWRKLQALLGFRFTPAALRLIVPTHLCIARLVRVVPASQLMLPVRSGISITGVVPLIRG